MVKLTKKNNRTDSVMILVEVFDDYEDACGWLNEYKRD
jgi:hypothetical protein